MLVDYLMVVFGEATTCALVDNRVEPTPEHATVVVQGINIMRDVLDKESDAWLLALMEVMVDLRKQALAIPEFATPSKSDQLDFVLPYQFGSYLVSLFIHKAWPLVPGAREVPPTNDLVI